MECSPTGINSRITIKPVGTGVPDGPRAIRESPLQSKISNAHKPVGVGAFDDPFINKKRVFGADEVSENSSLEKLIFLKFDFKDSRGRLSLQT